MVSWCVAAAAESVHGPPPLMVSARPRSTAPLRLAASPPGHGILLPAVVGVVVCPVWMVRECMRCMARCMSAWMTTSCCARTALAQGAPPLHNRLVLLRLPLLLLLLRLQPPLSCRTDASTCVCVCSPVRDSSDSDSPIICICGEGAVCGCTRAQASRPSAPTTYCCRAEIRCS